MLRIVLILLTATSIAACSDHGYDENIALTHKIIQESHRKNFDAIFKSFYAKSPWIMKKDTAYVRRLAEYFDALYLDEFDVEKKVHGYHFDRRRPMQIIWISTGKKQHMVELMFVQSGSQWRLDRYTIWDSIQSGPIFR